MANPTRLNRPQGAFTKLPQKFRGFVGGYGSGKTWVGCHELVQHFKEHARVPAGYFGASYPQIRDIFYPTMDEVATAHGFTTRVKSADKEVELYHGRRYYGTIICRSMERPESIIGFKIGRALVDEIDTLPMVKAQMAWRKIIARLRHVKPGLTNGIDVTTTPEGFKFVHHQFVTQIREKPELAGLYGLVQASTYDNRKRLPADYIPSLLASYPAQLIEAYINGQFVNLKTGSVYIAYNREANDCADIIQPNEPLFIGMDFNVGKMAGIVHVLRDRLPRAVDEVIDGYDTPDMIRRLKERYWRYEEGGYIPAHPIHVYPDASGGARDSSGASETDLALLRQAGFQVVAPRANPPVKDRINSMNGMFCNALGQRRYLVNHRACPVYTAALEQQAWADNGDPDKKTGHDHPNDAAGYFIHHDFPIITKRATSGDMYK